MILVGIDPGVKTGIGIRIGKSSQAKTLKIHEALNLVEQLVHEDPVHVRVEDARLRKWFGNNSAKKKQGAGSVKRDCKIWEDFLQDLHETSGGLLTYQFIHPIKGGTKVSSETFKNLTGIKGRTSQHARDAFMIIYNYKHKSNL